MKVLVTGGAGYIGSAVVSELVRAGDEPVVYDNLSKGHRAAVASAPLVVGDLADADHLARTLADNDCEAVMHFAALSLVAESMREPGRYYTENVIGSLRVLEAMRETGVEIVVFSSTAAVYGDPEATPIDEEHRTAPVNPYGRTKLAVEGMLESFREAHSIGYATLRYFNAAGAAADGAIGEDHDPETHLVPIVLKAALDGGSVDVYGSDYPTADGTAVRDYVHVVDLAEAHIEALRALRPGDGRVYNLGTNSGHSVLEVIGAAAKVAGRPIDHRIGARRPGDPPALVASHERIARELGWRPKRGLEDILRTAFEWHRSHPEGYAD